MALNAYITATQSLLGDLAAQRFSIPQLTTFINIGRSQIALQGACARFNFGVDGITLSGTFTSGSPTVSGVTLPTLDTITNWNLTGGPVPVGATVSSSGAGAITMSQNANQTGTFSFIVGPPNNTVNSQEFYSLPSNVCLTRGFANVIGVRSVSVAYGGFGSNFYMLRNKDWTWFQAYLRAYPSFIGNPAYWSRYQDRVVLRPIPSSGYPMLWDCACSVVNLVDDTTAEAIPYSFTDAIPYFAARLAFLQAQRKEDADAMKAICNEFVQIGRRNVQDTFVPNVYSSLD